MGWLNQSRVWRKRPTQKAGHLRSNQDRSTRPVASASNGSCIGPPDGREHLERGIVSHPLVRKHRAGEGSTNDLRALRAARAPEADPAYWIDQADQAHRLAHLPVLRPAGEGG